VITALIVTNIVEKWKGGAVRNLVELDNTLIKAHMLHLGVYARVTLKLGVDPSFVSRVATGKRTSPTIRRAIAEELRKISALHGTKRSHR
jgi:hypothetical protein